jgi:transposase-like protein
MQSFFNEQTSTRAKWTYLYRAVDKYGKTVTSVLRPDRGTTPRCRRATEVR